MMEIEEQKLPYHLGAKDVVLLVEELHKRGYERLRFFGYVSPNGVAYRVHILRKEDVDWTGYFEYHSETFQKHLLWYSSVGSRCCGISPEALADAFATYYPELLQAGKGKDPEYVFWFRKVVWLAHHDAYPNGISDYMDSHKKGCIPCVGMNDKDWVLPMPPTGEHRHLEPYYRFYKGESANPHALHTVRHNIWAHEQRFERLWAMFTEQEWEAYFKGYEALPYIAYLHHPAVGRKEGHFRRYMDIHLPFRLLPVLPHCHYYKGELRNPYPDDGTAKAQRLGWDGERTDYYIKKKESSF